MLQVLNYTIGIILAKHMLTASIHLLTYVWRVWRYFISDYNN